MSPVAIVTGAGRGIGRAIAQRLARDGFAVAVADLDAAAGEAVAAAIAAGGGRALAHPVDVADADSVRALVAATTERLGPLDAMVANAGIAHVAPLAEATAADLEALFRVNVVGTLHSIQQAAAAMGEHGRGGRIVVASSVTGRQGMPLLGLYSATKFAIVGLVQAAARELAPAGITVNAYCPGVVETPMNDGVSAGLDAQLGVAPGVAVSEFAKTIALGRLAQPDEIAGLAAFLASNDARYMTGQSIAIDGGLVFV
ncbi:SDR family oxidoreductase [Conexibacter arvalis]|uniref:Meso-butanediol dehydrogenase/(S,S)-butanediol dehydrogenase/diacetyl reductase n=1 Tax=Conexibacter arvalis TaxID=912552 RepID=A0A840ICA2_9ACTN|nr:SDR family oxidoreductase [Conexibacter arvalis]MBB4661724.1 meso-butanediol dehydrogenase/(S,S)-butanediol dehydrogenase/diacetyl reductase [Conexibacter arvalis]